MDGIDPCSEAAGGSGRERTISTVYPACLRSAARAAAATDVEYNSAIPPRRFGCVAHNGQACLLKPCANVTLIRRRAVFYVAHLGARANSGIGLANSHDAQVVRGGSPLSLSSGGAPATSRTSARCPRTRGSGWPTCWRTSRSGARSSSSSSSPLRRRGNVGQPDRRWSSA